MAPETGPGAPRTRDKQIDAKVLFAVIGGFIVLAIVFSIGIMAYAISYSRSARERLQTERVEREKKERVDALAASAAERKRREQRISSFSLEAFLKSLNPVDVLIKEEKLYPAKAELDTLSRELQEIQQSPRRD